MELPIPDGFQGDSLETYAEALIAVVNQPHVRKLCAAHLAQYFSENLWDELLPVEWRDHLEQGDMWEQICGLFTLLSDPCQVPSELRASAPKGPDLPDSMSEFYQKIEKVILKRKCERDLVESELSVAVAVGMKRKKLHEIRRLLAYLDNATDKENIRHVVDIGAGRGYLSRALAVKLGMNVLAVDERGSNTRGAKRLDKSSRFTKHANKLSAQGRGSLVHVEKSISDPSLDELVLDWQGDQASEQRTMVVGLHACGDLSMTIVRMLIENEQVDTVAVVACCYHLIKEFPVSNYYKQRNVSMTNNEIMLGCQAPWSWTRETSSSFFKRHYFRALLSKLLAERKVVPEHEDFAIGTMPKGAFDDFSSYVTTAMNKLGFEDPEVTPRFITEFEERHRMHYRRIAMLWSVKSSLSQLVESLVVIDRVLWLQEQGAQVTVNPIFDYEISPRNLIINARKKKSTGE